MKPSNILVNGDCSVKIADYGLCRSVDQEKAMSIYVVTRWYRPPEIMLGNKLYGPAVGPTSDPPPPCP
jgi:serine/threonine protein kinase